MTCHAPATATLPASSLTLHAHHGAGVTLSWTLCPKACAVCPTVTPTSGFGLIYVEVSKGHGSKTE